MKKEPCSRSGEMEFQESALGSRDNLLGAQRCGSRNLAPNALTLSDSQTQLIHRYLDGECSYIARFFARRLLQTSSEARSYFNTLRDTAEKVCESTAMKAAALERESLSTEQMWARIQRRIEVEERASVLLGERNVVGTPSSVARMARERGTLGVVLDSLSEMFLGRRGSVFGGMAAITTCCVLVVMSISSPEVADKIMLQSGEGDIYPEGSELASESRLSFVESSNSAGSEITPRSEIRILPFSRSLPIDFVSARPNTFLQASPSRQGRHMQGDLPPWNATQMSFENHVSNSTEDYPLTSGTFDPFLFDDLLGQAYENNSSEAEVLWGSSLPPQIAVSGNYKGGRGTVGNDAVTRHDGGLERSTPSSVILREQIIPKTNFASR